MAKNIVICCDGTGNEFGGSNSNVVKLYQGLVCDPGQLTYYHPGVGTLGARSALTQMGKWWTRLIGLAFGYGISDNVADAYRFLMRRFEPNDRVYVFGFGRGAYTARALCGMLHIVGLLTEDNEALIPYAIRMNKRKKIDFQVIADLGNSHQQRRGCYGSAVLVRPAKQVRQFAAYRKSAAGFPSARLQLGAWKEMCRKRSLLQKEIEHARRFFETVAVVNSP